MKRINVPLVLGTLLLVILLTIVLFPQRFTSLDPSYKDPIKISNVVIDGKETLRIQTALREPSKDNIMGTDEFGRDIYTRLVYGAKPTLKTALMIVLYRILLAIPFGILAGIGSKKATSIIRFFNTLFTTIPVLFAAFFILNIKYVANLQVEDSIVVFAVVLTVMGWGKLGSQVEEKVRQIRREDFIEGEVAVGKNKLQITLHNILPHLIPSLISFIFIEVALVIFLLAQLSILQIFVGPRLHYRVERTSTGWLVAENPEWASMLSRILINNRIGDYWLGLFPALAFTVGILAFNLTGEGLSLEFEKRNSRVISTIRRLGFIFSPRVYFHQVMKFKTYYKPVLTKSLCMLLVVSYMLIPPPSSLYHFQTEEAMVHLEELTKPIYEGRLPGFEGNYLAGDYIVEKLKEYGLKPYDAENYIQEFPLSVSYFHGIAAGNVLIKDATIRLTSEDGDVADYYLHDDFAVAYITSDSVNKANELVDEEGYINLSGISSTRDKTQNLTSNRDELMIVDTIDSYENIWKGVLGNTTGGFLGINSPPYVNFDSDVMFLFIKDQKHQLFPSFIERNTSIIVKGELAEKLKSNQYKVEVRIKAPILPNKGRNILAVLPGENWNNPLDSNNKKEVIFIGASYDGLGMINNESSAMRTSGAAINLEIARVLSQVKEPFNKTIIFAFWDGDSVPSPGSGYYNNNQRIFHQMYHDIIYLDVGFAGNEETMNLNFAAPDNSSAEIYKITNKVVNNLKKNKVSYVLRPSNSLNFYNFGQNLTFKVSVSSPNYDLKDTVDDNIENINQKQVKNIGQFFIDLITMNEFFK